MEIKAIMPTKDFPRWRFRCYGDEEELYAVRDWVIERYPYPPTSKKLKEEEARSREILHSALREVYSHPKKTYKYTVSFRDPEPAMLFKLTWCGK